MIFLRYESFGSYLRMYPVTALLLAVNIVVFLVDLFAGVNQAQSLIGRGAFVLMADDPYGFAEPWRYITAVFLHSGWSHLIFNCFSLLVFAPPLERKLGHVSYGLFYLLSGIAGHLATVIMFNAAQPDVVYATVGAPGAIYGIFGAYLCLTLFRRQELDEASRKTVFSILIFGLIYSVFSPTINFWGHIGGGVGGFLLYSLFHRPKRNRPEGHSWN
jgi:membrane associated rhomboid family serine protease